MLRPEAASADDGEEDEGPKTSVDFGGPGTTCNTITTAFPSHASCDLAVVFHSQSSGPLTSTILFQFTDAPDFALVATGTGTRTWSAETFSNPYNFTAVHGSERNDIYVVDQSSGNSVQHWNGATWSNVTGHGIVDPHLTSVYALDATHVWVGGSDSTAQGISSTSDQGLNWSPNLIVGMATGSGNIHTLYAATATNLFAVTDTSAGGLVLHSTNGLNWSSAGMVLGNMPIRTLGVMGSNFLSVGTRGW